MKEIKKNINLVLVQNRKIKNLVQIVSRKSQFVNWFFHVCILMCQSVTRRYLSQFDPSPHKYNATNVELAESQLSKIAQE